MCEWHVVHFDVVFSCGEGKKTADDTEGMLVV